VTAAECKAGKNDKTPITMGWKLAKLGQSVNMKSFRSSDDLIKTCGWHKIKLFIILDTK